MVEKCEKMIVDSLLEELKVGPQKTQAIPIRDGFLGLADGIITIGYDAWVQLPG